MFLILRWLGLGVSRNIEENVFSGILEAEDSVISLNFGRKDFTISGLHF